MARLSILLICAFAIVVSGVGAANVAGVASPAELTFTRVSGERYSVWVADTDGSAARIIAEPARNGALSSDGRWLTYSRLREGRYGAQFAGRYVVSLAEGKPRRLVRLVDEEWAPDGATLAIADRTSLFVFDPTSGSRRVLVRGRYIHSMSFSPDGRAVAFVWGNGRYGPAYQSDIFSVRLSDGLIRRLTYDGHNASPLWGSDWIVYERFRWLRGIGSPGKLFLMRFDGSGKRMFARGAEGLYRRIPAYGLTPLALSSDGRRLLACQSLEFSCPRVTFTVPGARRFGFPRLSALEQKRSGTAEDLSPDGTRVLVDIGNPHDVRGHGIYEIPFAGGKLRLLADSAIEGSWRH